MGGGRSPLFAVHECLDFHKHFINASLSAYLKHQENNSKPVIILLVKIRKYCKQNQQLVRHTSCCCA